MITPADQQAVALEDEVEQAGVASVLLKYPLDPANELSGKLRRLNILYPCRSAGSPGE